MMVVKASEDNKQKLENIYILLTTLKGMVGQWPVWHMFLKIKIYALFLVNGIRSSVKCFMVRLVNTKCLM